MSLWSNLITADYTAKAKVVKASEHASQYDFGQTLQINFPVGTQITKIPEIHWAYDSPDTWYREVTATKTIGAVSVTSSATKITSYVPDTLLKESGELHAYVYTNTAEYGQTEFLVVINVLSRAKPGTISGENNPSIWGGVIDTVSEYATAASNSAIAAENSASASASSEANAIVYSDISKGWAVGNGGFEKTSDEFLDESKVHADIGLSDYYQYHEDDNTFTRVPVLSEDPARSEIPPYGYYFIKPMTASGEYHFFRSRMPDGWGSMINEDPRTYPLYENFLTNWSDTNNSHYWSEVSRKAAEEASTSATSAAESAAAAATYDDSTGEYARQASVSAYQAEQYKNSAEDYANSALTYSTNASESEQNALSYKNAAQAASENTLENAQKAAESVTKAKTSETNAAASETAAKTAAQTAADDAIAACGDIVDKVKDEVDGITDEAQGYADDAKAWAVGPNGYGTGTDTNNSKYYASQSEAYKNEAALYLENMKEVAKLVIPDLYLDLETMELYVSNPQDATIDFKMDDAVLYWKVNTVAA